MIALNFRLRRNFLVFWCLGLWSFLAIFPGTYHSYYPTTVARDSFIKQMENHQGMIALYGRVSSPSSLGQIVAWEAGAQLLILSSIMAVLLISFWHRKSEYAGLTELQYAQGLARGTPLNAAIASLLCVSILVGSGCSTVLAVAGRGYPEMDLMGAAVFGGNVALTMFGSGLLAQVWLLFVGERAAIGRIALLSVGVSFMLRALADTEEWNVLNWLSPLGWKALVSPYVENNLNVLGFLLCANVVLALVLVWSEKYRGYQEALVRIPRYQRGSPRRVSGLVSLAFLLNRGTVITWSLVIAALTAFMIGLTRTLSEWMSSDPSMGKALRDLLGEGKLEVEFIVYIMKLSGILLSVLLVQLLIATYNSEKERTLEYARATGIQRTAPLRSQLIVVLAAALLGSFAMYLGGLAGQWGNATASTGEKEAIFYGTLSQLAPALLLCAFAVALYGLWPRVTHAAWIPLIGAGFLTLFGTMLPVQDWLVSLSPFEHAVASRGDDLLADWGVHLFMLLLSLGLGALGLWGTHRRELSA